MSEFKFRHFSLNEWISTGVKNCLNYWNQRELINGLYVMSEIALCNQQYFLEAENVTARRE